MFYQSLLAILLLLPGIAVADWRDLHGTIHQDSPSVKGAGPLSAQLFFRQSNNETIEHWGTLANRIFIPSQISVKRNESIFAMIGFNGCVESPDGKCNLTVKFKLFTPSGSLDGESPEMELWQR